MVSQTQLQLLQFHHMLFTLYPPALAPVDYPTRLLRSCLSRYSAIISSDRPTASASLAANVANGKRGKKRARGAEDGLIGGLEGRESRAASHATVQAVEASLKREHRGVYQGAKLTFSGRSAAFNTAPCAITPDLLDPPPPVSAYPPSDDIGIFVWIAIASVAVA